MIAAAITWIEANKTASLLILSHVILFLTAIVATMPKPGTTLDKAALYKWLYDCLHQQFNINKTADSTTLNGIPVKDNP